MAYQVIARKWRPQTFEEVTGQEAVTRTLRNAIEHERLHHAYLFSGARGVGKTTTARLLAKAVNCHRSAAPTPTPCRTDDPEQCPSCREISEGRSIDVLEIDAASNTGVGNVRDTIIDTIGVRAARDRYKVFIIDEVHMLSIPAFNALLKTLEEPPPRVLFIMATTESHKLPDTILSRCQQFEFRTIAAPKIAARLRYIADEEKIKVSDDALREIARAGEGSMRDAQSAFDQVISFSEGAIETADVEAALGLASVELRARVMRAVVEGAPSEALAVVDDLVMRGHDLRNFCRDLLAHVRDLLVVKVAGDSTAFADSTDAERGELKHEAREFSESDLVRFFHSLTETEKHLRESAHPRYQLEIGLVKLIEMRRLVPLGQLFERLNALEEALRTGKTPAVSSSAQTPPTSSAAPSGSSSRRGSDAASGSKGAASVGDAAHHDRAPARVENTEEHATKSQDERGGATLPPPPVFKSPDATATSATPTPSTQAAQRPPSSSSIPAATLKLVPPPPVPPPTSVAGAGVATQLAPTPASEVPFPVGNNGGPKGSFDSAEPSSFFEEVRAGEDRAGRRVPVSAPPQSPASATASSTPAPGMFDAPIRPHVEPGDTVGLIKRTLDERNKPLLAVTLDGARRVSVEGDELCVEFAPEGKHMRDTLSKPENMRVLREACCEVLGREMGVRINTRTQGESEDDSTRQDDARREQQRLRELAEGHPLVQQVLKTFRGEIIEVQPLNARGPQP
jgi:DNA polymerase-3 subunit gamma/tau